MTGSYEDRSACMIVQVDCTGCGGNETGGEAGTAGDAARWRYGTVIDTDTTIPAVVL